MAERTRHWIEVYPAGNDLGARVVCESPGSCSETDDTLLGASPCSVAEWADATSVPELLHWPYDDHPVIGRLEVDVDWGPGGEDLTLVKPAMVSPEVLALPPEPAAGRTVEIQRPDLDGYFGRTWTRWDYPSLPRWRGDNGAWKTWWGLLDLAGPSGVRLLPADGEA